MISFKELPTDLFSSIGKHIQSNLTDYAIFFEGSEARRDNSDTPLLGVEVRVNGPGVSNLSGGDYLINVAVDLLITAAISDNLYIIHDMVGACVNVLNTQIPIHTLETGAFLGCLTLDKRSRKDYSVETQHYGQIDENKPVLQASVSAEFHMNISGD